MLCQRPKVPVDETVRRHAAGGFGAHGAAAADTPFVGDQADDLKAAFHAGCQRACAHRAWPQDVGPGLPSGCRARVYVSTTLQVPWRPSWAANCRLLEKRAARLSSANLPELAQLGKANGLASTPTIGRLANQMTCGRAQAKSSSTIIQPSREQPIVVNDAGRQFVRGALIAAPERGLPGQYAVAAAIVDQHRLGRVTCGRRPGKNLLT